MARVREELPLQCPRSGGDIRLNAFINEPALIRKIFMQLGELLEPPPVSPARGPPTNWGEFVQTHDEHDVVQATDRRAVCDRHPLAVRSSDPLADARMRTRPAPSTKHLLAGAAETGNPRDDRPGRHQPWLTRNPPSGQRWRKCH